jgi:hypothetical protein
MIGSKTLSSKQESRGPGGRRPFRHRHIEQLLSNYRQLTPDEQRQLQTHLTTCAGCRQRLAAFQQIDQLLRQSEWQTPKRRLKEGFYAAVDVERAKRPSIWAGKWSFLSRWAGQALSFALLTLVVAAVWLLMRQQASGPTAPGGETTEPPTAVSSATPLPDSNALLLRMTLTEPGSAAILALSGDGQFLAAAQGPQVQIWATSSGRLLQSLDIGSETAVDLAFTPNDLYLVVRTSAERLQRWRVAGGVRLPDRETTPLLAPDLPFAVDNGHLAVATVDDQVELWELTTGKFKKTITNHDHLLTYLGFSADGEMLLTGDSSGAIHLWDLNTHTETNTLIGPQQPVVFLASSPLGDHIAAAFAGGQVKLFSNPEGTPLRTLPAREAALLDMRFARDGDTFFRLFQDGTLEHWSTDDDKPYSALTAPALISGEFAPLPKGLVLAAIGRDGGVTLWDKPE